MQALSHPADSAWKCPGGGWCPQEVPSSLWSCSGHPQKRLSPRQDSASEVMAGWKTGCPLDSRHAKGGTRGAKDTQALGAAATRPDPASGAAGRNRWGHRGAQTPAETHGGGGVGVRGERCWDSSPLPSHPPIAPTGKLRRGGGVPVGAGKGGSKRGRGGLTWRAGPARGPGRAAAPSRASRRGEDRPRGGGGGGGAPAPAGLSTGPGRGRRRGPPAARCAALQPRRRPPGSALRVPLRAPLRAGGEEGESWASLLRVGGGEGPGAGSYLPAQGLPPPAPPRGLSAGGGGRTAEPNPRICLLPGSEHRQLV